MTKLACLGFAALGCGEGSLDSAEPVGAVAQSLSLEPRSVLVISNLNQLDAFPNRRSTNGGPFPISPMEDCHHVQSAAKYKGYYLLSHSMPDAGHLAVVDPNGTVNKVLLPPFGGSGRSHVHPGGIQVMGDVLAVALSDKPNCAPLPGPELEDVVRFYNISNPLSPLPGALPDLVVGGPQAVAATRLGASTVVAVLTGTRSLRFFKLADGTKTWLDLGRWGDDTNPPDQMECSSPGLEWCRPDTINFYRETPDGTNQVKLLTFSRGTKDINHSGDRERIGVYDVTGFAGQTPTVSFIKTYEFLPTGSKGNFRYGGGSEVTEDGALMAFAFPKRLTDGGSTPFARYGGWSGASEYDSGRDATVALNDAGVAVQLHQGSSSDKLYYRVGQVDMVTREISWGGSIYWRKGAKPSVALDGSGNVVVLHTVYNDVTPDIFACTGKVNVAARTIAWYTVRGSQPEDICEITDTGTNPTLAMNRDGGVIEVHNGSRDDNRTKLYARVGRLDTVNHRVVFGTSQSFDTGLHSSVTVNRAGTVVEAHNGSSAVTDQNLYFTVGRANFSTKTLTWAQSGSKHGTGSYPSIGLNDSDRLVELHHDSGEHDRIYFTVGTVLSDTIEWKAHVGGRRDAHPGDPGTDVAVAISSFALLETHNLPSSNSETALWYSVANLALLP